MSSHVSLNFHKLMERYLAYRNDWVDSTRYEARNAIPKFFAWLGDRSITPENVQEYYDFIGKHINGGTADKIAKHTSQFLRWLNTDGWLKIDPSEGVKKPKATVAGVMTAYTRDEYIKLRDGITKPYNEVIIVLWSTGMSIVDAIELKWFEIDLNEMMIFKKRKKMISRGGSLQKIPIFQNTDLDRLIQSRMKRIRNRKPEDRFFPELETRDMKQHGNIIKAACISLGVTWRGTQGFRRAVCSALGNAKHLNILQGMAMSGHKDIDVFRDKYVTVDHELLRQNIAEALKNHF